MASKQANLHLMSIYSRKIMFIMNLIKTILFTITKKLFLETRNFIWLVNALKIQKFLIICTERKKYTNATNEIVKFNNNSL